VRCDGDGRRAGARGGGSGDDAARTAGARTRLVRAAAALARRLSVAWARWSGRGTRGEAAVGGAGARRGARGRGVRAIGTRCATADKRGPLVSDFQIKNLPRRKLA
jgi:hypothetical protein